MKVLKVLEARCGAEACSFSGEQVAQNISSSDEASRLTEWVVK